MGIFNPIFSRILRPPFGSILDELIVEYLIQDEFLTSEPAPMTNPRTSEPSGHQLTLTLNSTYSFIACDYLKVPDGKQIDGNFVSDALTRATGLSFAGLMGASGTANTCQIPVGFDDVGNSMPLYASTQMVGRNFRVWQVDGTNLITFTNLLTYAYGLVDQVIVLRSYGFLPFIRDYNDFTSYTLVYVPILGSESTLYAGFRLGNQSDQLDAVRVFQLPEPFDTDYGLVTDQKGNQSFYLLRDEFITNRAIGAIDGTAAEPGPGTRRDEDGDNLTIADGILKFARGTNDYISYNDTFERSTGLAMLVKTTANTTRYRSSTIGFTSALFALNRQTSIRTYTSGEVQTFDNTNIVNPAWTFSAYENTALIVVNTLRSLGGFNIISFDGGSTYYLVWVGHESTTDPVYAGIETGTPTANDADPQVEYIRVAQLPAPYDTDYGIATDYKLGDLSNDDQISAENYYVAEVTIKTLTTGALMRYFLQYTDAGNKLHLRINEDGSVNLYKHVGGVQTSAGSIGAGVISNGSRIVCICGTGKVYNIFVDNVSYINTTISDLPLGNSSYVGTNGDGQFENGINWPRTLSGDAKNVLELFAGKFFPFHDDFLVDDSAPLTDPRTTYPGSQSVDITDTNNLMSVSNGRLEIAEAYANAAYDPGYVSSDTFDFSVGGMAAVIKFHMRQGVGDERIQFGIGDAVNNIDLGFRHVNYSNCNVITSDYSYNTSLLLSATDYNKAVFVARQNGGDFHFYKTPTGDWRLEYVGSWYNYNSASYLQYVAEGASYSVYSTVEFMRVASLVDAGFNTEFGLATDYDDSSPAQGTTIEHATSAHIESRLTPEPDSDTVDLAFRWTDDNNHWLSRFTESGGSGTIKLIEVNGGVEVERASTGVSPGSSLGLCAWCDGDYVSAVYMRGSGQLYTAPNNARAGYNSTFNNTATTAKLMTHAMDDIASFPITPTAAQIAVLEYVTESVGVAVGTTFEHEADCLIEYEVTQLPVSSGYIKVGFRIQDSTNRWYLQCDDSGAMALFEEVSGSPVSRGSSGIGTLKSGDRIVIICDDESITVLSQDVIRITYTSAANFKTETDGQVIQLEEGSIIDYINTWPRTLSGDAVDILDAFTEVTEWLLRDDFLIDDAPPLTNAKTCVLGPGKLYSLSTSANLGTIDGYMYNVGIGNVTSNVGSTRASGLASYIGEISPNIESSVTFFAGWFQQLGHNSYQDVIYKNAGSIYYRTHYVQSVTSDQVFWVIVILRSTGAFYLVKSSVDFLEWTLLFVDEIGTDSTLYSGNYVTYNAGVNDALWGTEREFQLDTPWNTDYGIATETNLGSVSQGTTFTHEADFVLEFTVTTLPN